MTYLIYFGFTQGNFTKTIKDQTFNISYLEQHDTWRILSGKQPLSLTFIEGLLNIL